MPLLNYSTSIAPQKTVGEVTQKLIEHGANAITLRFDDKRDPVGVSFLLDGRDYLLPANWLPVRVTLKKQGVEPRYQTDEQAKRVAWRIVKDWIEAQLAIVETGMVKFDEVMLPYMLTDWLNEAEQRPMTVTEVFQRKGGLPLLPGPVHKP